MTQTLTGHFRDLGIEKDILSILTKKGFTTPTPIQEQVIPGALSGTDIIGIAQTGTGKTFAFGIPMVQHLIKEKGQGLILVPTRELAIQVESALRVIGSPLGLRTAVIIGGVSQYKQIEALKKSPHIIIATPGRLVDLMDQGKCKLGQISVVTLDEADRMLDMGFMPNITKIMEQIGSDRQTLLFSATMPSSIAKLANEFMHTPLRIEIAPQGTSSKNVEQEVYVIRGNDKSRLLDAVLSEYVDDTVLVFSRTKHGAKRIARDIRNMGHTATEIHGNRSQAQRKIALEGFTKRKFRVLVATDIAARGIDVEHISLVVNYDLPDSLEDYVHRIGRTGRAGRYGKAISFVATDQKYKIKHIERLIRATLTVLDLPALPEKREVTFEDNNNRGSYQGRRTSNNNFSGKKPYRKRSRTGNSTSSSGRSDSGRKRNRPEQRNKPMGKRRPQRRRKNTSQE